MMSDSIADGLRSHCFRQAILREWTVLLGLVACGLVAVAASGVIIAKLVDDVLGADGITRLDPHITDWVVGHRSQRLTVVVKAFTTLGDPRWVLATVALVSVLFVVLHRPRLAVFVIVSSTGAALVTMTAKLLVGRPRPDSINWLVDASGAAFPSGHATQSVACWAASAAALVLLVKRPVPRMLITLVGVILAVGIGASRIYLGVHWTSDVVCGWAVASLWLVTLLLIGWAGPRLVTGARSALSSMSIPVAGGHHNDRS